VENFWEGLGAKCQNGIPGNQIERIFEVNFQNILTSATLKLFDSLSDDVSGRFKTAFYLNSKLVWKKEFLCVQGATNRLANQSPENFTDGDGTDAFPISLRNSVKEGATQKLS
jgi:hypothetical protein